MTSKASIDGTSSREFWWPAREHGHSHAVEVCLAHREQYLASRLDTALHLQALLIHALYVDKPHAASADAHKLTSKHAVTTCKSQRCRACAPLWTQLNGLPFASPSGAYKAGYLTPYFLRAWPTN